MKYRCPDPGDSVIPSSPSRGTWIEILGDCKTTYAVLVVPLTGDVD